METENGVVRVGITGFLDPALVQIARPGWQVQAPRRALEPVLAELSRTADVVVVLAHANVLVTDRVLDGLPAPDVVVIAHESDDPLEPVPVILRGVPALAPGTQAKYLARADITIGAGAPRVTPTYEGLNELIPDAPLVRALLENYQELLKQMNIPDLTPRRPYATGGAYVGPRICAECHTTAHAAWSEAKHSHALAIVVERTHEFDPDCLVCHTTGFGYAGGYESRAKTPELALVGCESCHGPGSNHVEAPGAGYGHVKTPDLCITCHDTPNSPQFAFDTYWPKIAHGHD